ncbi:MAG TPA: DUF5686 family protein [Flavobacteriaceae bacterium]|nr:DUF5686 family protein [Flavobacteriaceae bacterium]
MRSKFLFYFLFCLSPSILAQTRVSGKLVDQAGSGVPFANVLFTNTSEGTITNDDGSFYLESQQIRDSITFSYLGYKSVTLALKSTYVTDLKVVMEPEASSLGTVVIYNGKTSKKNNPAIDILRKIWEHRRKNGLEQFDHYQYDKYEKLEFDINTIDSAFINNRIFNGMEFIFDEMDTSSVTGKTFLPIFINEAYYKIYGDNVLDKEKAVMLGNKNSGFNNNKTLIDYVKDMYKEYDVYDNYLKFYDKSFVSPLSTTGINVYNYVLADSAFIGDKWCYNIVYYPRRKNELTFKGDFWVNDTTWAIKKINLQVTKSANINWIRDIYIEQEFDVLNDSIFLLTRDYFMSDFSFREKNDAKGIYGKRTTLYDNYNFKIKKPEEFYKQHPDPYNYDIYHRPDEFWEEKRMEALNENERQVYKMLDTLKTVNAFKRLYDIGSILVTGYVDFNGWDYGPIFSTFGYNDVEGIRLRAGGRTYFSHNDPWRIEGYLAYGFKDDKFKYGISGKVLLDRKLRLILMGGNRRDVEQLGASLTNTTDVLGRSLASSSLITVGSNNSLTNINLSTAALEMEPAKNFKVRIGGSVRTLEPASPQFSLDYYTDETHTQTKSEIRQAEISTILTYAPGMKTSGYGVERSIINDGDFPQFFLNYSVGLEDVFESDFEYEKVQFFYRQPWLVGGFGKMTSTFEAGKTFGAVPLGLLSVVPGNQTYFSLFGSFPLLNYYEFVTDTYVSLHLEHNFGGRIFSRIPVIKNWNLREIVTIRGVWGEISEESQALNASTSHPVLFAPSEEPYWSYSLGIGNMFKVFRLDFHFRGNYFDTPDARSFGITGTFGFYF